MPKCPACIAGYLALFTGVGVSTGFAAGLRVFVIFVTLAALFLFAVRLLKTHKNAKP
jgi:hypothetical protein